MPPLQFASLKQTLCRFFSDKRVKVSLFLQDGLQKNDGAITLQYSGPLPPGVELPGQITRYGDSLVVLRVDSYSFPAVETIDGVMPLGPPIHPARGAACELGMNMYSKERAAPPPSAQLAAEEAAAAAAAAVERKGPGVGVKKAVLDSVAAEKAILSAAAAKVSKSDLNLLADLLGVGSQQVGGASGAPDFKLNLFPDTSMSAGSGGRSGVIETKLDPGAASTATWKTSCAAERASKRSSIRSPTKSSSSATKSSPMTSRARSKISASRASTFVRHSPARPPAAFARSATAKTCRRVRPLKSAWPSASSRRSRSVNRFIKNHLRRSTAMN
jgi:hypothetical protein